MDTFILEVVSGVGDICRDKIITVNMYLVSVNKCSSVIPGVHFAK